MVEVHTPEQAHILVMAEAHTEVYTPEQVVYKAELEAHILEQAHTLEMVEAHTEALQADQAELVPPKTSPVEGN
jgi:hypothetical protein